MSGIHDMGGVDGFGKVEPEFDEPVFHETWEGRVMAMSRAMGETAPMVVVGASTFIVSDPTGPFSKFTTLPIQIYNWTAQPDEQFRNIAAAAILVLLIILLSLNMIAILLRNKMRNTN